MQNLSDHFKNVTCTPQAGWEDRLFVRLARVEQERRHRIRMVALLGIGLSLSFAGWGVTAYGSALLSSPFWSLLALLASDLGAIFQTLPDFAYSLLETLPIVPLLVLFAPLTLFFWSLSFWTKLTERRSSLIQVEVI